MKNLVVIGAGTMGSGIAQSAAQAGFTVFLVEQNPEVLEKARAAISKSLQTLAEKGKLAAGEDQAILSRLRFSTQLQHGEMADLVVEAIVEIPSVKLQLFKALSSMVRPDCILASNTSSLSITSLAAAVSHPGRFIGMHFFNPATVMKLVEVIPAVQTDPETTRVVIDCLKVWGKIPVEAKDTPGFIVNRVARPFYGEALRIADEGMAPPGVVDLAMKRHGGFPMGPFELMDFIGHDINYTVTETVFHAFYQDSRYTPSFTQKRLVEAGFLGRKSGRGFYFYPEGPPSLVPEPDPELLDKILNRILVMLINEAAETCYYGVAKAEDIELAMTRGVNYPKGLLHWADEIGIQTVVNQLDSLFEEYHEPRYRCSVLLRRMARESRAFFPDSNG
jgi:3-hydroxybutyryl-CoA dehydrogenase